MAIIAMKQKATRKRPGAKDDWGNVTSEPSELTLKCRADEVTAVVQNQLGDEVVSSVSFLFDKLADIRYDDVISYTNELGVTVERTPVRIEPIRITKAMLTRVYV
jgi:hypothetical protein